MKAPARTLKERKLDTIRRLEGDVDVWVATADPASGTPYLVPLSYMWDGKTLLVATPAASPTSRNLQVTGLARLALGHTRDVVIIEARVEVIRADELPSTVADAFAARSGFEPARSARRTTTFGCTRI
jgi:hypothetical protein